MTFQQIQTATKKEAAEYIEQLAHGHVASLIDSDELSGLIASTNAFGWGIDTLEVDTDSIEITPSEIVCTANIQFCGDQDVDRGPLGDTISGTLQIRIGSELAVDFSDCEFSVDDNFDDY